MKYFSAFSYRQRFVPDEMQSDDLGHSVFIAIAKMTADGIPEHLPQFLYRISLRRDGMAKRDSHEAPIHLIFPDFKNYLFHERNIARCDTPGQVSTSGHPATAANSAHLRQEVASARDGGRSQHKRSAPLSPPTAWHVSGFVRARG